MANAITEYCGVSRQGVYKRFPKVKSFLEGYTWGGGLWTDDKMLQNLRRYASEGIFPSHPGLPPDHPLHGAIYRVRSAHGDLLRMGNSHAWSAIQAALKDEPGWLEIWRRAASYRYWAERMEFRIHQDVLREFGTSQGRHTLFLERIGVAIGNCMSLGWTDWAADLARRSNSAMDNGWAYNDAGDRFGRRRTHHFILRLVDDWQGWPVRQQAQTCKCAFDEPLFNALIAQWRAPEVDVVEFLLLAACDRHTQQSRVDSHSRWEFYDCREKADWYNPFEILSVLRLRELFGLRNPTLDHPLMATPLGVLPPVTDPYSDSLLEGVLARARSEFSDF